MGIALDKHRNWHGILPPTDRCYNCGVSIKYLRHRQGVRYYCSMECRLQKPPKMVLAELYWGRSFDELALEHLNNGGSIEALAGMCGVHRQAVLKWLRVRGIHRVTRWVKGWSNRDGTEGRVE